jgi:hypothetical protein
MTRHRVDEDENWEIFDKLRAAVRAKSYDPDDLIPACISIVAETLLGLDGDLDKHVKTTKQLLDTYVDAYKALKR